MTGKRTHRLPLFTRDIPDPKKCAYITYRGKFGNRQGGMKCKAGAIFGTGYCENHLSDRAKQRLIEEGVLKKYRRWKMKAFRETFTGETYK